MWLTLLLAIRNVTVSTTGTLKASNSSRGQPKNDGTHVCTHVSAHVYAHPEGLEKQSEVAEVRKQLLAVALAQKLIECAVQRRLARVPATYRS